MCQKYDKLNAVTLNEITYIMFVIYMVLCHCYHLKSG